MSTICIFRRLPCGSFEHFMTSTNSWNYFEANRPEVPSNGSVDISFFAYVNALRKEVKFTQGMPNSMGIRHYPITVCRETGRVEIAEGSVMMAEVGVFYAIECRRIFEPARVRLTRLIKSHVRDYCYLRLLDSEEVLDAKSDTAS